ncbi:hypothetical protein ABK040_009413 [Willaertia magna]
MLLNSKKIALIVIDVVFDFVEVSGIFAKTYGEDDVKPLVEVKNKIIDTLSELKDTNDGSLISTICCQSIYKHKQFRKKGLEDLCVTKEGQECMIQPLSKFFDYSIVKSTNSIFDLLEFKEISTNSTKPKEEFIELLRQHDYVMIMGVTTTSCVRISVEALIQLGFKVMLPKDWIACRKTQTKEGEEFYEKVKESVTIIDSCKQLEL